MTRVRAGLRFVAIGALALLYSSAYGAVGIYVSLFIEAFYVPPYWVTVWLMAWAMLAAVVLTVWTIRLTGIGAAWFRQDRFRPADTFTREGATSRP